MNVLISSWNNKSLFLSDCHGTTDACVWGVCGANYSVSKTTRSDASWRQRERERKKREKVIIFSITTNCDDDHVCCLPFPAGSISCNFQKCAISHRRKTLGLFCCWPQAFNRCHIHERKKWIARQGLLFIYFFFLLEREREKGIKDRGR